MAITLITGGTATHGANAATFALAFSGATPVANDVCVVGSQTVNGSVTSDDGFTELYTDNDSDEIQVWWKKLTDGTTLTIFKKDGSTTAATVTLDSATDPTSRKRAT